MTISSDSIKHQVHVTTHCTYVAEQSDPEKQQYVFAYTITIRNQGSLSVKLLSRHWVITDAEGGTQEVRGEGVIGQQPYIKAGEKFEYTSGAILPTPIGSMHGSYQMLADDGILFDADIPAFSLAIPHMLH